MLSRQDMRAAVQRRLRLVPGTGRYGSRGRHATAWILPAIVVLAIAGVMLANILGLSAERRALRALPAEQRLALLSRTVEELRQVCGEGRPDALKDHCRELASFAARFDECRGECEALVRHQLTPVPRR
jgi:hypothetical protein